MQEEVNESSQEKGNTLKVSSTKGFRVERREKMKGREEKYSTNRNALKILYFIKVLLRSKEGIVWIILLGHDQENLAPNRHYIILTCFGLGF
jgi:hypothetical protein